MDKLHNYVPVQQVVESYDTFSDGNPIEIEEHAFHQILLGGDQLSAAHAHGRPAIRADHIIRICTSRDRLVGLLPVVEDWYAKQCMLKVHNLPYKTLKHSCILCGCLFCG